MILRTFAYTLLLGSAAAVAAPLAVQTGDVTNGGKLFRMHCADCHGVMAGGDGTLAAGLDKKPTALRDGSYLWSRPIDAIVETFTRVTDDAPAYHGRGLSPQDQRDIVAWLRDGVPRLEDMFGAASEYIAHRQQIDKDGQQRAEKVLGAPLSEAERRILIYAMFKPEPPAEGDKPVVRRGPPELVPEEPAAIYGCKPKRRIGFVGFVPLELDGGTFQVALALNRSMMLTDVKSVPAGDAKSEALRKKLQPMLAAYEGSGGAEDKVPVQSQDRTIKPPADLQKAMLKAYERVLEGSAMFQKEERERFILDPDAFKLPSAEDMGEVKFDFKEKKGKK